MLSSITPTRWGMFEKARVRRFKKTAFMQRASLMGSKLNCVTDFYARAEGTAYRVCALAQACGVTARHLRRFFRLKFGMSPHEWLAERRLDRSIASLQHSKLVKEVAVEAGFNDPAHFARLFKQHHGFPPSAFRLLGEASPSASHHRAAK